MQWLMTHMTNEQLDSDITIEDYDDFGQVYCHPAELRFTGPDHEAGLGLCHPVLTYDTNDVRHDDISLQTYLDNLIMEGTFDE